MEENITQAPSIPSLNIHSSSQLDIHHLVKWIDPTLLTQLNTLGDQQTTSDMQSTKVILRILEKVNSDYFSISMNYNQMQQSLVEYFYQTFGFYVSPLLNTTKVKNQNVALLVLYSCLYCKNKQIFVQQILKLNDETQKNLINEIEGLQSNLKQIRSWDKMIEEVKKVQKQNNQLRKLLNDQKQESERYLQQIETLKQELQETKKQRNMLVLEKRKILGQFQLSSMAQYEDLSLKLYHQNDMHVEQKKQLTKIIKELEIQICQLKVSQSNSDKVIVELNADNCNLQKFIEELRWEIMRYEQKSSQITLSRYSKGSKIQQSTQDVTMRSTLVDTDKICQEEALPSTITDMRNIHNNFKMEQDLFSCSNSSNFSKKSRNTGRGSAWGMFHAVKENVLLAQKTRKFQEQIQMLQLKIIQLENQIVKSGKKQKFYLRKNRKIQQISDQFGQQYNKIKQSRPMEA